MVQETTRNAIAAAAGITSALSVLPLDIVKLRLQNNSTIYHGTFSTMFKIYKQEGIKSFFKGVNPTVLAYLLDRAIWFTFYEKFKHSFESPSKDQLSFRQQSHSPSSPYTLVSPSTPIYSETIKSQVIAVIFASFLSNAFTMPIWVIRTRIMTQSPYSHHHYSSIRHAIFQIYKNEGIFAFYRGFIPSLVGIIHPAIQFPLYEYLKRLIDKRNDPNGSNIPNPSQLNQPLNHLKILEAGSISKIIAGVVTYPHEIIRTRLQTYKHSSLNPPKRPLIFSITKEIWNEGWRTFYKGLGTNLIRQVPSTVISLWTFEWVKSKL